MILMRKVLNTIVAEILGNKYYYSNRELFCYYSYLAVMVGLVIWFYLYTSR
jgi:hypothetical protein